MQVEALPAEALEAVEPGVSAILHVICAQVRREAHQLGLASLLKQHARAKKAVNAAQSQLVRHEATAAVLQQDRWSDRALQEANDHVKAAQQTLCNEQHEEHALSVSLSHVQNKLASFRQKLAAHVHAELRDAPLRM